ncbi:MAG: adenosylcobinamide-GDP ribazoletransferase [Halorubrum sp.]
MLTAIRGALGFFTRIPTGQSEAAWDAFVRAPWTFPVVGYLIGGVVAVPVAFAALASLPPLTVAVAATVVVYAVTGITHLDGVADLGDAAVVHGDAADRRSVMRDSALGVGGTLALVLVVTGLVTGLFGVVGVATDPSGGVGFAVALVVTAEVAARAAAGSLVCLGDAAHSGLGSTVTEAVGPRAALPVLALVAPAVVLGWPRLGPGVAAVLAAMSGAAVLYRWANRQIGGVSGDVLGATTELARVAALHTGVIVWTLS